MKNKHLPLLAFVALGLVCATNSFATMTVTLTQNTSKYSGANGGGEFKAVTTGNGTFQTFCIDYNHEFQPGHTYDYTISQETYKGSGNDISIGTAWLYNQFLNGTLNGYDYSPGTGEKASATLLQDTLWALEGELSSYQNSFYLNVKNSIFYKDLMDVFGNSASIKADSNGAYGVAVMNLYDPAKRNALIQSQLVRCYTPPVVSVPEPSTIVAGALLLLPLGVSALKVLRRKQITAS